MLDVFLSGARLEEETERWSNYTPPTLIVKANSNWLLENIFGYKLIVISGVFFTREHLWHTLQELSHVRWDLPEKLFELFLSCCIKDLPPENLPCKPQVSFCPPNQGLKMLHLSPVWKLRNYERNERLIQSCNICLVFTKTQIRLCISHFVQFAGLLLRYWALYQDLSRIYNCSNIWHCIF